MDERQAAKEYVDKALAERSKLGYTRAVPKKSVSRAVAQAADVFTSLRRLQDRGRTETG
jgi:hypothetical protein